jgi:hypothetical protein
MAATKSVFPHCNKMEPARHRPPEHRVWQRKFREIWAIGTTLVSSLVLSFWSGRAILERHRKDRR